MSSIIVHLNIYQSIILCFSTTASKLPLSCERRGWSPVNLSRTPSTTWSPGSEPYTVLPPIEKPIMRRVPDQNTTDPTHRRMSDGYLALMEKQKQRSTMITYKVECSAIAPSSVWYSVSTLICMLQMIN